MRQTISQAEVKILTMNVKHLMTSTLHMTQTQDIQRGVPNGIE